MTKHNTYFEGKVQSIGFERNGRKATAGVIDAGEFHFGTDAPERMTVTSGELHVRFRFAPGAPVLEVQRHELFEAGRHRPRGCARSITRRRSSMTEA